MKTGKIRDRKRFQSTTFSVDSRYGKREAQSKKCLLLTLSQVISAQEVTTGSGFEKSCIDGKER